MRKQGVRLTLSLFKLFFICFYIFFISQVAGAAEWNGEKSITVKNGETLYVRNGKDPQAYYIDDVTVQEGGTLVLASDYFGISQKLINNNGTIQVGSDLSINTSIGSIINTGRIEISYKFRENDDSSSAPHADGTSVYIPVNQFMNLIKDGKLIVGDNDTSPINPDEVNTDKKTLVWIGQNESGTSFTFDSSQFITNFTAPANNTIVMGTSGTLRFGAHPVTINGNELNIGTIKFNEVFDKMNEIISSSGGDKDISDTGMSRIRGHNIILKPENGIVTLKAGILQIGAGQDPNTETGLGKSSHLQIGEKIEGQNNKDKSTLNIHGGALVLGAGGNMEGILSVDGNIVIGNTPADNSSIPDSALITKAGEWLINGNLTLNQSGYLEVGQTYINSNGDPLTSTLTIDGNFEIYKDYTIQQNTLNVLKDTIGNEHTKLIAKDGGKLLINNANMNGAQIALAENSENSEAAIARSFREASNIINAPQGAITFASNTIDARINVGQNSLLTLGSNDQKWLLDKVAEYQTKNNKVWGQDITAALAIRNPQTLSPLGGLNVDGNWKIGGAPAIANQARFADKSLFVVDAAGVGDSAALTGDGTTSSLVVESGAQLLVTDGKLGDTVVITDKFVSSSISEDGWNANVSTPLYQAEGELLDPATGTYVVRINDGASPQTAFPMLSSELDAVVARAKTKGLDTNSANPGVKFISRAVDNRYIGANDPENAAATIESAARMVVLGAAPQMTMAANNAAGAAITQRTGLAQPNSILMAVDESGNHIIESQKRFARNFALWVMPLYQSANGFGMEAGNFSYDFNGALGGVALGGDYTFEDTFRIGLAFNIGGGYAQGSGDLNKTTNNMNFWGVGAYAGWTQNNFGLTADVSYTSTYNKIKQDLPESMQMGDLKSDIRGNAISAGLRAEYKILTNYVDIVPHVGFRYTSLFFDSYNAKSGGKVLHGDKFEQNIWTFPIGASFSKEYEMANNWHFKPLLDLNVTPAAGDIKARTKVRFNGIDEKAQIDTKMMDYITYGGTAGFEIGNDTVTLGVDYNGQFGAESSAHGVYGTLRVEF